MRFITVVLSFVLLALSLPMVCMSSLSNLFTGWNSLWMLIINSHVFGAPADAGIVESHSGNFMDSIPEDFAMEPMTFNGTIGGIPIIYDGTIQEIVAYMQREYPSFRFDADIPAGSTDAVAAGSSMIKARYEGKPSDGKGNIYCCPVFNQGWKPAVSSRIGQGINYLNRITGNLVVKARSCSRVSCSYNSAIALCNDKYETLSADSRWIASFASDLNIACVSYEGEGLFNDLTKMTCGQEFSADRNYNVIANRAKC
ncbi:hypothetical protein VTL71DRAFT_4852 [Oculimacula yallundae]|uniref:Uncharacterized protein n=1 Tax=Oculimacula yallundae TaxID=86028 RepID=A0ABR4C5I9_9HELO